MTGKEILMALEFTPAYTSMTMTVVSEQYPKGKKYNFNRMITEPTTDQVAKLVEGIGALVSGKEVETLLHKTQDVHEEDIIPED